MAAFLGMVQPPEQKPPSRRWGDTAAFARILRIILAENAKPVKPVTTRGVSYAAESAGWLLEAYPKNRIPLNCMIRY